MWRPGNAVLSRWEKPNLSPGRPNPPEGPGKNFTGRRPKLRSGYALPPFQAAAFPRLILINAEVSG